MRCSDIQDDLSAYLDGELASTEARRVASHLADCSGCANELDSLRAVVSWTARIPEVAPPTFLRARVLGSLIPAPPSALQRAWAAFRQVSVARPLVWAGCAGAAVALVLASQRPPVSSGPILTPAPEVARVQPVPPPVTVKEVPPPSAVALKPAPAVDPSPASLETEQRPPLKVERLVLAPPKSGPLTAGPATLKPERPVVSTRKTLPSRTPAPPTVGDASTVPAASGTTTPSQPRSGEPPAADPPGPRPMAAAPSDTSPPTTMGMMTDPPKMAGTMMMNVPAMSDDDSVSEFRKFLDEHKTSPGTTPRKPQENPDGEDPQPDAG